MLRRTHKSYNFLADLGAESPVNFKPLFIESVKESLEELTEVVYVESDCDEPEAQQGAKKS